MTFKENKPIYLQIADRIMDEILQEVYEEAAYTWFNRLMAIRIMQKNGLCEPVLVYTNSARPPRIVDEARMNRMPQMPEETRTHLMELLNNDTKVTEQFALLAVQVLAKQQKTLQAGDLFRAEETDAGLVEQQAALDPPPT